MFTAGIQRFLGINKENYVGPKEAILVTAKQV